MNLNYSGIAAADELDRLNSADDFEPSHDIDTIALDAIPEALAEAARLVEALLALQANLVAGGDAGTAAGLKLDVRLATGALGALTVELGA